MNEVTVSVTWPCRFDLLGWGDTSGSGEYRAMSEAAVLNQVTTAGAKMSVSHFWVSAGPYFETTLFTVPCQLGDPNEKRVHTFQLFDADGAEINSVELELPAHRLGVVALKDLTGGCKFESGIKHAHLVVRSPAGFRQLCRIHTSEKAAFMGEPVVLTDAKPTFFPVLVAEDRSTFIGLVNHASIDAIVRCRLFCGRRTPETECVIPPQGTRFINVETAFAEQAGAVEGKRLQAYLRLGTKAATPVGAILVEQVRIVNDKDFFTSVV